MTAASTRSGTRRRQSRTSRNRRSDPAKNTSALRATTQSSSSPSTQPAAQGVVRSSWDWISRYSNNFILLVAILALLGAFPADAQTVVNVWRHYHPVLLSNQAILNQAETWGPTAYLNDGQGANSKSWIANPPTNISPSISASAGLLAVELKPGNEGGYSFLLDTAQNANLPAGNYFLSMEIAGSPDCEYGITFNAEQTTTRLAWLFIDDIQSVRYGLQVLEADGKLSEAFPEVRYYGPVDSLGIVHYDNKYVVEIDGTALRSIDSDVLTNLDNGLPLTAPGIGVGMYTCGGSGGFQFQFSNMQLQVPQSS